MIIGYNLDEVAKSLATLAKLTADNTKNWDNFEKLAKQVLEQVFEAGKNSK